MMAGRSHPNIELRQRREITDIPPRSKLDAFGEEAEDIEITNSITFPHRIECASWSAFKLTAPAPRNSMKQRH
jgi:hypothetical protein